MESAEELAMFIMWSESPKPISYHPETSGPSRISLTSGAHGESRRRCEIVAIMRDGMPVLEAKTFGENEEDAARAWLVERGVRE